MEKLITAGVDIQLLPKKPGQAARSSLQHAAVAAGTSPCRATAKKTGTSCKKLVKAAVAAGTSPCRATAQKTGTSCKKLVKAAVAAGTSPCRAPALKARAS